MVNQRINILGRAYLAGSSKQNNARLEYDVLLDGDARLSVFFDDGNTVCRASLSQVELVPRLGSSPRKFIFDDNTVFETDDHDSVALIEPKSVSKYISKLEQMGLHMVGFVIAAFALFWVIWRYGLDILVAGAIAFTPPVVIEQMDRSTLQFIDTIMAEPSQLSSAEQQRISDIYEALIAVLPEQRQNEHTFSLEFRHMPNIGPNAFALPGGTMVITDEMVQQFPQQDILAGVLGHEISHVTQQHGIKRLYRSLGLFFMISLMAGETGPILEEIILEGNLLLSLQFSREQEHEADELGIGLAHAAHFDPAGIKTFFQSIDDENTAPVLEWLSTHPLGENRIENINAALEKLHSH